MTYEMSFLEHVEHDKHINHLLKNKNDLELRTIKYYLSDDSSDEDNEEDIELLMNLDKFIKQKSKNKNELESRMRPKKRKAPKDGF
ncbi:unnamed protein product [Musa textilis]